MTPPEPCFPHTECWCEQHPNNPQCDQYVPIDNNLFSIFIVFAAILLTFKKLKM